MYVMLWCIDVGDYVGVLEIGCYVLCYGWVMLLGNCNVQIVLVEEMVDVVQSVMFVVIGFDVDLLLQMLELIDGLDMLDQLWVCLYKVIGVVLSESNLVFVFNYFNYVLQFDFCCGVKKDKQQLECRLCNDSC